MSQEQYFSSQSMITGWWRRGKTKSFMKHSGDKAEEDSGMTALNEARTPFFQPCGGPKKPVCLFFCTCVHFPSSVPRKPASAACMALWLYRTSYPPHIPRFEMSSLDLRQPEQPQVWSWGHPGTTSRRVRNQYPKNSYEYCSETRSLT